MSWKFVSKISASLFPQNNFDTVFSGIGTGQERKGKFLLLGSGNLKIFFYEIYKKYVFPSSLFMNLIPYIAIFLFANWNLFE